MSYLEVFSSSEDISVLPILVLTHSQVLKLLAFHIEGKWKFFEYYRLRTKCLVNYNSAQKDAMLSFCLIFPKTFILMGQSKTNELSLIVYRMFGSKRIASLSVLITLNKIKSIKFTKPREKNQIVLPTWKSFSLQKISFFSSYLSMVPLYIMA